MLTRAVCILTKFSSFTYFCSLGFVEFKSLRPIRVITELRDVEYEGMGVTALQDM